MDEIVRVKVETVPLPDRRWNTVYGFLDDLQPGQSVVVPASTNVSSMKACITYRTKKFGKRYATRTVPGGLGTRVWRIS